MSPQLCRFMDAGQLSPPNASSFGVQKPAQQRKRSPPISWAILHPQRPKTWQGESSAARPSRISDWNSNSDPLGHGVISARGHQHRFDRVLVRPVYPLPEAAPQALLLPSRQSPVGLLSGQVISYRSLQGHPGRRLRRRRLSSVVLTFWRALTSTNRAQCTRPSHFRSGQ
jgi:hypothetical protein